MIGKVIFKTLFKLYKFIHHLKNTLAILSFTLDHIQATTQSKHNQKTIPPIAPN